MYNHIDRENPIIAVEVGVWEAAIACIALKKKNEDTNNYKQL